MKTKHTKGEWVVEVHSSLLYRYDILGKVNDKFHVPNQEESKANIKLIAAAPELLEVLKSALAIFGRGYEPKEGAEDTVGSRLYLEMESAIKKATE